MHSDYSDFPLTGVGKVSLFMLLILAFVFSTLRWLIQHPSNESLKGWWARRPKWRDM